MNRNKKLALLLIVFIAAIYKFYTFNKNDYIRKENGRQIVFNTVLTRNAPPIVHRPHQHVYYMRTHKTGSTTIHNILAEYCRTHDLLPLLPSNENHINQRAHFRPDMLMLDDKISKYDMVFSHHVYDPRILDYIHNDSFRVTSLRDAYTNFVSAFLYYKKTWKLDYLKIKVKTDDQIAYFLRNHEKLNPTSYKSMTNNRQSMDLGYDKSKGFDNVTYIKEFLQLSDSRFDLVILMEHFDEGLVMMKRMLHWNTEDILYYTKNVGSHYKSYKTDNASLEEERRRLHASFSQPDILVYKYFLDRFKKQKEKEVDLEDEVAEFRNLLVKFRNFCDGLKVTLETLWIPAGKWNGEFQLTYFKCKMLSKEQSSIINFMKDRQKNVLNSKIDSSSDEVKELEL